MRPITVLYIDNSIGFGGSSKSLALTFRGLRNVRKLMLTSQDPELVRSLFGDVRLWRFRRVINYRTRERLMKYLAERVESRALKLLALKCYALVDVVIAWISLIRILAIVRRQDVDIVHLNNGFEQVEGIWAAWIAGIPSVVHLRGFEPRAIGGAFLRLASKVSGVITVSDAIARDLRPTLPKSNIVTIYDSVDLAASKAAAPRRSEARRELGVRDGDVLVGIFGRVVPWKGQKEFVRATLLAMKRDPRIVGIIVGDSSDGSEDYMRTVEDLIEGSGCADRFIMTGYREHVEELYAAVDIAVHASTSPEPFGMVIPEAMAASRPVIAADAGGPREIITDGVDGIRVDPSDVEAMGREILRIARDPQLGETLGRRACDTVSSRFTISHNARAVQRLYDEILTCPRGPVLI